MREEKPRQSTQMTGHRQPTRQLFSLRTELDDLFNNFFGTPAVPGSSEAALPSMDVSETPTTVEVKTDVPGFKSEDIHIELHDDLLTITGEYSTEQKSDEEKKKFHRVERRSGSFSRTVRLPAEVVPENVDAELKDGVLTVVLPKSSETRSRRINIRS